jgi:hypothetical protein
MIIAKVISGGQSGVDQSAWRAARRCGIATGGLMVPGFLTERPDGHGTESHPEFASDYGAGEIKPCGRIGLAGLYRLRTVANIGAADCTLLLCRGRKGKESPGTKLALGILCGTPTIPHALVDLEYEPLAIAMVHWLVKVYRDAGHPLVLNVGGNRESAAPGIGAAAEEFLVEVFRRLAPIAAVP